MHEKTIEKVSAADMKKHLEERLAAISATEEIVSLEDGKTVTRPNPAYQEKVDYETARAAYGFNASCDCGWQANNPLPSEADAEEAVKEHYAAVNNALGG